MKTKPFSDTGKVGLFSKKVKCLHCDYTMLSTKQHGNHYLKCGTRHIAKDACIGAFVPVSKLEEIVRMELQRLVDEYLNKTELERRLEFTNKTQNEIDKSEKALKAYQKRIDESRKAVRDLYLDKTRGIITEDDFIEMSKEFHDDKTKYENLIRQTQDNITSLEERIKSADDKSMILSKYLNVEKLTREHVVSLIDTIYVGHKDPETKEMPVEIHWNF